MKTVQQKYNIHGIWLKYDYIIKEWGERLDITVWFLLIKRISDGGQVCAFVVDSAF